MRRRLASAAPARPTATPERPHAHNGRRRPGLGFLLETAVRAGLLISPLTTALGSADGLTAETAVDLVLSSSPVLPVVTDPDLADELLAGITDMRKELVEQAARLGDARLSGQPTASAAAAVQFDSEAHTLPLPDDDCVEAAIAAVNQNGPVLV